MFNSSNSNDFYVRNIRQIAKGLELDPLAGYNLYNKEAIFWKMGMENNSGYIYKAAK